MHPTPQREPRPGCRTGGLKTDACPVDMGMEGLEPFSGMRACAFEWLVLSLSRKIMTCLSLKVLKELQWWVTLFSVMRSSPESRGWVS